MMAFPLRSQPLYIALYHIGILHLLFFSPLEGTINGYTTNFISRDSPLSPFYKPSSTHFDRLRDAFQRSFKRVNHFKSAIQTPMKIGGGEYLMKISLGTPPVEVIGIADTGSDLIWTQCLPCSECYQQNIPYFDPSHSSSYKTIPCQSSFCKSLQYLMCDKNSTCEYGITYGDGSHSSGNLASETLTLGFNNSNSIQNIVFGCGRDTRGIFDVSGSGIIGLASGKLSLISQTDGFFGKRFSYCLVPTSINSTSKISFGEDAMVSGPGVITTPIVTKSPDTLYYLFLEALSVGTERIAFNDPNNAVEGNIIIDSGTTLTILPTEVFNGLVSALDKIITVPKVRDPNNQLSACYKIVGDKFKLPIITAHFKGGDVQLKPVNSFSRVNKDVLCLAMTENPEFSIYGNLAQMNFLVGFDIEAGTVSFKPTDCVKE